MKRQAQHKQVNRDKNVPVSRFLSFSDEWNEALFGKSFDFKQTNSFSRDALTYDGGEVKNIHYGDIHTKFQTMFDITQEDVPFLNDNVDLSKIKKDNYCEEGDLVIADASEDYADVGKSIELKNLNRQKLVAGLHTYIARPKKGIFTKGFSGYLMQSWTLRKQIMMLANGSKVLGISTGNLKQVIFKIPTLPEQQKIAGFLSAVDEKLQHLNRKKELLEQYKKGVMQKLFSQELRFKQADGTDYPDWEEKRLGVAINLLSGYAFKGEDISEGANGVPLLRGINITEGVIRHSVEIDRYYNGALAGLDKFQVAVNDLVIGMDGSKVGKNSALVTNADEGALLIQRVARLRALDGYDIRFVYHHIRSSRFIGYVDTVNTSSGIPHISAKQINDFTIEFPCQEEQQKIADFLSSLDEKIDAVSAQIELTQQFKKGLLQEMFV